MDYNQAAETFLSCVKSRSKTEVMSRFSKCAWRKAVLVSMRMEKNSRFVGLYKNTGSPNFT